jgi:hypothetical protein
MDDLRANATLVASLAYLASEDPEFITRERVDLSAQPAAPAGRMGPAPTTWPVCTPGARKTNPRLK